VDFVEAINKVAGLRRKPMNIPRSILLGVSYPIDAVARMFNISQPISPVRVRKLFRSTNVRPAVLEGYEYPYLYTMEGIFADWKADSPQDFARAFK
jgi:GlcNAc-P-P-Und epimerase